MRCVLLTGGHAAGKTTVFNAVKARHADHLSWRWIHADNEMRVGPATDERLLALWMDPSLTSLVLEGRYVYAPLFRVALAAERGRDLWIGLTLQSYAVGRDHIRQRCEKRGKPFSPWWEQEAAHVEYDFGPRYSRALDRFLQRNGGRCPIHTQTFWIDSEYKILPEVEAWFEEAVTTP